MEWSIITIISFQPRGYHVVLGDGGRGDISSTPHGGGVLKENWLPNNCQGLIGGSGEFNRETIQILQSLSLTPLPLPGDKYWLFPLLLSVIHKRC